MSYGQNPYGQNPYGGQPQQPYGQRPYGGQQPNPYGQPPQQGQPNPYGQPQQPNPYGQPQQNPYGRAPQNPYGQPQQNPYGQPQQGQPGQQHPYGQPQPGQGQPQHGQGQRAQSAPSAGGPESWQAAQPPPAPESLASSTPLTIAQHAVPVHTLGDDPESFIDRTLGEVIGVALRPHAKDPASLTKARQDAVSRMAEMAKAANADAVVGLRFDSNADEIVAYGTAVIFSDELELDAFVDDEDGDHDDKVSGHGTARLSAAAAAVAESSDRGGTDFSGPPGSDEGPRPRSMASSEPGHDEETPFSEGPDDADATRLGGPGSTGEKPAENTATHADSASTFDAATPASASEPGDSSSTWNPSRYSSPYGQSNPYTQSGNPYAQGAGQSQQSGSDQRGSGPDDQSGRSSQGWPFSGS